MDENSPIIIMQVAATIKVARAARRVIRRSERRVTARFEFRPVVQVDNTVPFRNCIWHERRIAFVRRGVEGLFRMSGTFKIS